MTQAVGMDCVEIARIEASWKEHGERFLQRIFLPAEIQYVLSHANPAIPLAARFAAKEAVSKALGTGIGQQVNWLDIEVVRQESGKPEVVLHGGALALMKKMGAGKILLSLTHTRDLAMATAILV